MQGRFELKGFARMIVAAIGILGALACEGCTYFAADDYIAPPKTGQIVLSPSNAMLVAAPLPVGSSKLEYTPPPELQPYERLELAEQVLIDYGVALPQTYAHGPYRANGPDTLSFTGPEGRASLTLSSAVRLSISEEPGWSSNPAVRAFQGGVDAQRLGGAQYQRNSFGAELAFAATSEFTGLGFDLGLAPRASILDEGDFSVRRVGAEFRLGQDIDQRGSEDGLPSWYLFAGADGEALIFNNTSAGSGLGLIDGVQLRDQVTVGDVQAGLNLRRYGANLSLSYIRREVEYNSSSVNFKRDEDFGGLTLSWRR
ncbi:MAG: hypothetical protein ABJG15_11395 [Hyphomonadaceae bacterium]